MNGEVIIPKTDAELNLEKVEADNLEKFLKEKVFFQQQNVLDMDNKASTFDESAANREKLKGCFKLKISKHMKMPQKIEKYAQEPVVFHLHKKRNFIRKIER
jgi:hypothetical protein